jgi:hypothetical protein
MGQSPGPLRRVVVSAISAGVRPGSNAGRATAGLLVCLLMLAGGGACKGGPKTPEEAYIRFVEAVRTKEAEQLYRALDLETRWSWMTIRRAHREAYDILLSNLPPGRERDQATRRFEAGALSEDDAALFAENLPDGRWQELERGLPPSPPALKSTSDNERQAPLLDGRSLPFRRGPDGRWGFAGLAAEAEEKKRRAVADLEIIRNNAADQERAATRAGK